MNPACCNGLLLYSRVDHIGKSPGKRVYLEETAGMSFCEYRVGPGLVSVPEG